MDGATSLRVAEDSFPVVWNLGLKTETQVYQDPSHRRLHFPLEIRRLWMTSAQRPFPVTAGKFPCNLMFFCFRGDVFLRMLQNVSLSSSASKSGSKEVLCSQTLLPLFSFL